MEKDKNLSLNLEEIDGFVNDTPLTKLCDIDGIENFEEIILPNGFTQIPDSFFEGLSNLKRVINTQNIKSIGKSAFKGTSISEIILPEGITKIDKSTFSGCVCLSKVTLPSTTEEIGNDAFRNCESLTQLILPKNLKKIGFQALMGCNGIRELVMPEGLKTIDKQAFSYCKSLEKVVFNKSLNSLGEMLFHGCENLKEVVLPKNLEVLPVSTFSNCQNLERIELPENMKLIGFNAFGDCENLREVKFPKGLQEIGGSAFSLCENLTNIEIPDGVTKIGDSAFSQCESLQKVILPKSLIGLNSNTFQGCYSLKEIVLPENLYVIGEMVFDETGIESLIIPDKITYLSQLGTMPNLKSVRLSKNLKHIKDFAFADCKSLIDIEIPQSVEHISQFAFENCQSLREITIPGRVNELAKNTFDGCKNLRRVNLSSNLSYIGQNCFLDCESLSEIDIPSNVEIIADSCFKNCSSLESVKLPFDLIDLQEEAFAGCKNLKQIIVPHKIEKIKERVFADCLSLESVKLPQGLVHIADEAFSGCQNLKSVIIPEKVDVIGMKAFSGCHSLKELTLPEGITSICAEAFNACSSLESLNLPKSLYLIGEDAFKNCLSLKKLSIEEAIIHKGLDSIGPNIQEIKIGKKCVCEDSVAFKNLHYLAKKDGYFYLTKEKINENSIDLRDFVNDKDNAIGLKFLMEKWDKREQIRKDLANGEGVEVLYNYLYKNLTKSKFDAFLEDKNFKFYKQIKLDTYPQNKEYFAKFYCALGGFKNPITKERKTKSGNIINVTVDYAQKIGEFFKEFLQKEESKLFIELLPNIADDINSLEFKPELTDFILEGDNFIAMLNEEKENPGFISDCFNRFEDFQGVNKSYKGSQRQLKPTIKQLKAYILSEKFSGVTEENSAIASTLSKFMFGQDEFNKALAIEKERVENKVGTDILSEKFNETEVFKNIDSFSLKFQKEYNDCLNNLVESTKNFSFEMLSKDDPLNFVLGRLCDCCAHLRGAGYGIMHASIVHPDVQTLIIRDEKGIAVAKSTLYINREKGYGIFNNVELKEKLNQQDTNQIYEKYKLGIHAFVEKYNKENPDRPLTKINVGMNRNGLYEQISEYNKKEKHNLSNLDYERYGNEMYHYNGDANVWQVILWESEEHERV